MANSSHKSVENTVLILPISSLSDYHHFGPWIDHAAQNTTTRLLVMLASPLFDVENSGISPTGAWKPMEYLFAFVYRRASRVAVRLDRVLMRIDVVLHAGAGTVLSGIERERNRDWNLVYVPEGGVNMEELPYWISEIPYLLLPRQEAPIHTTPAQSLRLETSPHPRHPVVALGGTFDHLHAGHKILLSMAAWIADRKIIVGVTDDSLLQKKSNKHIMETIDERMEGVHDFLDLFRPQIAQDVVPISDVYGPTATDADIQGLVVSKETIAGGQAIAKLRGGRGLPTLSTYVIDVISGETDEDLAAEEDAEKLKTAKMSSTYIREWIVKRDRAGA